MAIIVKTKRQISFSSTIKKFIEVDKVIDTWRYKNGYFTHTPKQWDGIAWIKCYKRKNNEYIFRYHLCDGVPYDQELYAVYMGRFAEMLLAHFSDIIVYMQITPEPDDSSKLHIRCSKSKFI